jgi:predicted HD phosphohydrolase
MQGGDRREEVVFSRSMSAEHRVEIAMRMLEMGRGQFHERFHGSLDDLEHSLQVATRAERDGADEEMIVAALCHDMGNTLDPNHHGRIAGDLLRPCVRPEVAWLLDVHSDFTARRFRRGWRRFADLKHRLHPHYRSARRFADEWDVPSRDSAYETMPLEHFRPVLERVLGRTSGYSRRRRAFEIATAPLTPRARQRVESIARRV